MNSLYNLGPEPIWRYFEEICEIPRLSKNEDKIRKYLIEFAARHRLESKEDEVGNILIIKPASRGFENKKPIVLQSHMDMVGEKNADNPHNWLEDPIVPYIREEWVAARGTTLGADDGIGIAVQLALLSDSEIRTGRIECLFTVDEESGMTGAINLKPDFFTGRILINLDSEDEGILFIGCAGGMDTLITMDYLPVKVPEGFEAFDISVTGLHGGHSGDEIHKGYANSVKIMTRLLSSLSTQYEALVSRFDGGNLRNAIPREAFATIYANPFFSIEIQKSVSEFSRTMKDEYGTLEPEMKISIRQGTLHGNAMDKESQNRLLSALTACPHGVVSWSKEMENLVETSSNLASVKFIEDNKIRIITTQRSSIESSKHDISSTVEACFRLAGAEVQMTDGYPGWKPNITSEILRVTRESYKRLFGKEPLVRAIHAGLECGLIYEKDRNMDMISFGPTIRGAHTPEEMISIETVRMFWDLLLDVIANIPEEKANQN
ncbi:MAG TPA: aminoacyl-histidine dipeptidase [Bacteroidales bacterium]|nr:aminoacyl-histidine dipeptidase [Bacteroidales bacterium]